MTYYFLADLHLNEHQPKITEHFLQFLAEKAPFAEGIYILGDLFDFWIGDDESSPLIEQVKSTLHKLSSKGVNIYFICGNRDFLIGKKFAEQTGITLLPDYHLLNLYGKRILICHGDTLCIDDLNYQKFRRKVHQKWRQLLFLCLPLCLRLKIAHKIRIQSQTDKQQKSAEMMDVNPQFTANVVEQYQADWLIHGHTHRQAVHFCKNFEKTDRLYTRIVLGDWRPNQSSIVKIDQNGYEFI